MPDGARQAREERRERRESLHESARAAAQAREICARHGNDPAALIEILHDLQDRAGFVSETALPEIAAALNVGKAEVHGVVSFYHDFRRAPPGRVVVRVCRAEACQSMGAQAILARLLARREAGLGETDPRGVTVEAVYCLGNCALAPAATVGGRLIGRIDAESLDRAIAEALE